MRPENLKNDTKFDELIKNNQLPVGFGILLQETFWQVLVCYMSVPIFIMYVKRSSRRTPLKVYRWRCRAILPHPFETNIRCKFSPGLMRVQSFMTFRACLGPQKCDSFRRRIIIIIIIIIIIKRDSRGSSHHRCSGPNNKQSRFKRVLTPSVLGP